MAPTKRSKKIPEVVNRSNFLYYVEQFFKSTDRKKKFFNPEFEQVRVKKIVE